MILGLYEAHLPVSNLCIKKIINRRMGKSIKRDELIDRGTLFFPYS